LAHLIHRLATDDGLVPDADLLRRFAEHRDEAAFELLVWRHGGMVWGVCRRVAPDRAAAEDAFQATALALARHARAIRRAPSVAGWLYRVAYRAALRTRARRRPEPLPPEVVGAEADPADAVAARELGAVIDAEVNRLPEPFRDAFVLCDLEGRPNAEAAAALGCAVGTIESRLTRARQKLRDRLARRGLALTAGALAVVAVPGAVHAAAVHTATDPALPPPVVCELAAHAARAGGPGYLRAGALALAAGALAIGFALAASKHADPPPNPDAPEPVKPVEPAKADPTPRQLGSSRFRHSGPVFHSAFSSDGTKLVTAALGSVSIWETKTGKMLRRVEQANVRFHRVAFAPDDKAVYAVVGPTKDGCELLTFDADTGKERSRVAITKAFYYGGEFSPDGARLAVYSLLITGEAILFDPKAGKELARVPAYFTGNGFTADGKGLVVAATDETVRVFDSTTGKETGNLEPNKDRPHWARFISPSAVVLAGTNHVERWDLKKNVRVWKTPGLFPQGTGLELSPDGKRVAHVSRLVILIDAETGKELPTRKQLNWDCTSARFSPDSKVLAVTDAAGTVALLDATTGDALPQSPDPLGFVGNLTFSADGKRLSAVAGEKWVRWDLTAVESRAEALAAFTCLSPDGRVGIRPDTFNRPDSEAEFVDPVSGKRVAKLDPPETGETVGISRAGLNGGLFSGDGTRFVARRRTARGPGGQQTDLGLGAWDTATGKRIAELPARGENVFHAVAAVAPDGKVFAVYELEQVPRGKVSVGLWEPGKQKPRWTVEIGGGQLFAAFVESGAKLIVQEFHPEPAPVGPPAFRGDVGYGPLRVLDAATGKERASVRGPVLGPQPALFARPEFYLTPTARTVSPDGKTFAVSGWDGTIYLWDIATDREKAKLAHPGPIHNLAFSPDGKTLAAASSAAPVAVYDLTARGAKP
jgi:RNA polymerase sigma factor (sigma-70 family)